MRRRLALALLRLTLRISTPRTRPWAEAMLAETSHVEGDWATLMWALGSSTVLLKRAVIDRFARPEEDLMQRPRILFSIGFTFLLLATLAIIVIAPEAYRTYTRYRTANGTIMSIESHTLHSAGPPAYSVTVHVQFQYGGAIYTPTVRLLTVKPQLRDEYLRRYVVGQPYSFMFDRRAPERPVGVVSPLAVHEIRIVFLASLSALLFSTALVYVGKKKAI